MRLVLILAVIVAGVAPAGAQTSVGRVPPPVRTVELEGPRVGLTVLSDGVLNRLHEHNLKVRPVITQFGWHFERQLYTGESGVTAVTEWVALVGGLEQGIALPSLSWLVGLRTESGKEFGIGPNVSPSGVALALAGGVTIRTGAFNVPVNLAVVPSRDGVRISVLTGFAIRRWR